MNMKYNDVVIGFGKGGKTIAGALGAAGCRPNTRALNLEAAGGEVNERGSIDSEGTGVGTARGTLIFTHPTMGEALNDLFNL